MKFNIGRDVAEVSSTLSRGCMQSGTSSISSFIEGLTKSLFDECKRRKFKADKNTLVVEEQPELFEHDYTIWITVCREGA